MKKLLITISAVFVLNALMAQKEILIPTDGGGSDGGTSTTITTETCTTPIVNADKANAITICSKLPLSVSNLAKAGNDATEITLPNSKLVETHSAWYTFTVATAGTIEFQIQPQVKNATDDIDFVLFKKNKLGGWDIIRAATNGPEVGGENITFCNGTALTGLQAGDPDMFTKDGCATSLESDNDGFVAAVNAVQRDEFLLCINNYFSCGGFQLDWLGSFELAPCPISTKIASNKGETVEVGEAYPNPTEDQINLLINQKELDFTPQSVDIHIIDLSGRVSKKISTTLTKGEQTINFDTTTFPQGIYQIVLDVNGNRYIRKFAKQ